ncbi:hypothetical protein [Halovulum sp. GXIMD14793]
MAETTDKDQPAPQVNAQHNQTAQLPQTPQPTSSGCPVDSAWP